MGFFDTPSSPCIMDLLDFNIDETETVDDDDIENPNSIPPLPLTECEGYEELEWISNNDVFPSVDTFVPSVETFSDVIPSDASIVALKHESPVSVLENSNSSFGSSNLNKSNADGQDLPPPFRHPRSKAFKRRQCGSFVDIPSHHWFELCQSIQAKETSGTSGGKTGRKCRHSGSEKTPQWRAGPDGAKTLCNACGVRFKSGRLCPEYRPANSPTFSDALHSNSHRKIVEMRKMKQMSNMPINPVDNG